VDTAKHLAVVRRLSTLVAAISIALLFYVVAFGLLLDRIRRWISIFVITNMVSPPGHVRAFGYSIHVGWPIALLSILPSMWLAFTIGSAVQRHYREKLGLCPECGLNVPCTWRGKCPRCGLRFGPDQLHTRVCIRG
jgi:hypothetical protein